jgi:hypothetical protein
MTQTLHKDKVLYNIIAYYQIIGGLYGLYSIITQLANLHTVSGLGVIIYLIITGFYLFSVYCGNLLRLKRKKGLQITKWSQLTQLFQFNISGVAFWYISGVGVSIGYGKADDLIQFLYLNLSSMYFKYNLRATEDFYFFINLIPLIIIFLIEKLERNMREKHELNESV